MRSLILLLACIAAANASCYYYYPGAYCYSSGPSLTAVPCLRYKPTCITYTCDIALAYPEDTCTKDMAETDVADLVDAFNTKLGEKKTAIETDLNTEKDTKFTKIDNDITAYKATNTAKINAYYDAKIQEDPDNTDAYNEKRSKAITDMEKKGDDAATAAKDCYEKSITRILERIDSHHESLKTRYEGCLNKRLEKIAAYNIKVDEKMDSMKTCLSDQLTKRKTALTTAFKNTLEKICADMDVDSVVDLYGAEIQAKINQYNTDYEALVDANAEILKGDYKCSYTCSGCKGASYACKRTPIDWKFDATLRPPCVSSRKYTYSPRYPCYNPITCADMVIKTREEKDTEITAIITAAVDAAKASKQTWMTEQEAINAKAITDYEKCVTDAHEAEILRLVELYTASGGEYTDEEKAAVADRETAQETEKTEAVNKYTTKVGDMYTAAKDKYDEVVEKYEARLNESKKCILDNYEACLTKRTNAITDFETRLKAKVDEMRTKLTDNTAEYNAKNLACYETFILAYVGEDNKDNADVVALVAAYGDKLTAADGTALTEFNEYWEDMIPRLVTDRGCRLTCKCTTLTACPFNYRPCIYLPKYQAKCYTPCYYKYYGGYLC